MKWARIACAVVVSAFVAVGIAVPAQAQGGDGICTITLQLPATVQPGATFTLTLAEDSDCATVSNPSTFTYGGLMTGRGAEADDGIRFSHTIGSGNATYQGVAPRPEYYHPWINGAGVEGAELVTNTMLSTWAAAVPAPSETPAPSATATAEPTATAAAASTVDPVPVSAPAPAPAVTPKPARALPAKTKRYASCAAVHHYFSGGIARVGVKRNRDGKHSYALRGVIRHSTVAYKQNRNLDRDHDGIVCEKTP